MEVYRQFGNDLAKANDDPSELLPVLDRVRAGAPRLTPFIPPSNKKE